MISAAAKEFIYHQEPGITLLHGDCLEILPLLEPESVQCCVTSPPYWGLRDYGIAEQLGVEGTLDEYILKLTQIFSYMNNALCADGTLWLNLGDSYNNVTPGARNKVRWPKQSRNDHRGKKQLSPEYKQKDLIGIPWRTAFALQAAGWYLRSDIIWHKPNPMPESVKDRPTKAHEYIFLMSKSAKYFYDADAIKEPMVQYERERRLKEKAKGLDSVYNIAADGKTGQQPQSKGGCIKNLKKRLDMAELGTRNKRTVWSISTKPYTGAHFAVFPPELIEPCILAGTKEGDTVIDPFSGSGTVGYVCKKHKRNYIGIELNKEYLDLSIERIGAQGVLL